jgi:hypothetical protein
MKKANGQEVLTLLYLVVLAGCMSSGGKGSMRQSNELVAADPNVVAVLMQCGLLKFFLCPFMHTQPRLLNTLIDYWHPDTEAFMLEGQSLVPTTEDIYFLTGLSRRGEPVNFQTFPAGMSKVSELIAEYCEARDRS